MISELASRRSRLQRVLSMELPHLVLCKFAHHVFPGLPGKLIWAITFPLDHILHCSVRIDLAIQDLFEIVLVSLIVSRWRCCYGSPRDSILMIRLQETDRKDIMSSSFVSLEIQLERSRPYPLENSLWPSHPMIQLLRRP